MGGGEGGVKWTEYPQILYAINIHTGLLLCGLTNKVLAPDCSGFNHYTLENSLKDMTKMNAVDYTRCMRRRTNLAPKNETCATGSAPVMVAQGTKHSR